MISVVVYGRNDAHGYNMHRRVALSLNCIAETLTDEDDEIVFVDYNTPDELPTLVEALADTLTDKCLDVLRVLRVPAAIHTERFADRTHLSVAEPVARNAAARRANPANRWLLSTNTDMVFVSRDGLSLSDVCTDLPDAYYGLPRFELPEWLWENLARDEPVDALEEISRLGPALRLDEATTSYEWIRFDAPGDFQLMLRADLEAIDGFNEDMLLGYHVDSNLSRRLLLHRGSIETLDDRVAAYHCNHNRTPTVYHDTAIANDFHEFFLSVQKAKLPNQRGTWGLVDVTLVEVPVRERTRRGRASALVEAAAPFAASPLAPSDAIAAQHALTYDSGHVLPFVADSLFIARPETTVAYIGANDVLRSMLARLVERLELEALRATDLDDPESVARVAADADVFVVDLGLDASVVDPSFVFERSAEADALRRRLDRVFGALQELIAIERERVRRGEHPRRVVLVNSTNGFWNGYVTTELDCSYSTIHSRVRRATVKARPALPAAAASPVRAEVVAEVPPGSDAAGGTGVRTLALPSLESAVVIDPMEDAIIRVYRRRLVFRATLNLLIRLGPLATWLTRTGRRKDVPEVPAPFAVASDGEKSLLFPMEGAVIDVYRRRPQFKAIVDVLLIAGGWATRAARFGRPPRRSTGGDAPA